MADYHREQQKDEALKILYDYMVNGSVPPDEQQARKICAKAMHFAVVDNILYFIDPKHKGKRRAAVPAHLQEKILKENHGGVMAGHFSGDRLFKLVSNKWWWETLYRDSITYCRNFPECAVVSGVGRAGRPQSQLADLFKFGV